MQTKQLHIIQKELIEITLPDFEAAHNWELNDRELFIEDVRKVIDRTFSENEEEDRYLLLEKLEIDLGSFKKEDLHTEMPGRLYTELQKALSPYFKGSGKSIYVNGDQKEWEKDQEAKEQYRLLTGSRGRLESFLFFLKAGYLPWWAAGLADWNKEWLDRLTAAEWTIIKDFFTANDNSPLLRLTTQVNDEFLATLLKGINGTQKTMDAWSWLLQLMKNLQQEYLVTEEKFADRIQTTSLSGYLKKALPSIQLLRQRYWSRWILHVLGKEIIPGLHYLFGDDKKILSFIQDLIRKKYPSVPVNSVPEFWKEELDQFYSKPDQPDQSVITDEQADEAKITLAAGLSPANKDTGLRREEENSFNSNVDKKGQPVKDKLTARKDQMPEPGEKIFISSAGLVLLHPFLPQLFRICGLLDEQYFKDADAQTTAIYLLNYLATGESRSPEHELLLPKLLCGMSWEDRLEPVEPPDEILQAAGEELLVEVIKHWTALRNTSANGLREAFLKRSGRLEFRDNGWQLLVEEKAQDVLLGRLPWGISIIKYPWMTGMLSVTWA
jgi:hypothetical protein